MSSDILNHDLLPFHLSILEHFHDPLTSDLLLLARGLGLRKILCTLMQIYDSPQNLVLLVNASPEEEAAIGEELGIMGCRNPGLRMVGYEMPKKDRQDLYKKGGLISVTSRILVVDMLQSDIPTDLITGLLMLHAERVNALSLEAFIVRLYREKNKKGFLKAFSDQPEHITSGLSPLKNIMKELQLRTVHIYPRFHTSVKDSLEKNRADVIELYQPMTKLMNDIHSGIVQCMSTTLSELKRSNTTLDLDDLNVENAYFRSFDAIVRRQLDPVWHKVGPRTKQLVNDLATLRRLLTYLLTYDALAFHAYLESIIASNSISASGAARQNHSPWLLTDAAHIIFQSAKRRCYTLAAPTVSRPPVIDLVDDEDAWDALDEIQGQSGNKDKGKAVERRRPKWLPGGMDMVLEELPKWSLLAEVLKEIEEEIMRQESAGMSSKGTNTVLVMTSSTQTSTALNEFLSSMDPEAAPGAQGRQMMEAKLRGYLWWKAKLNDDKKARPSEKPSDKPVPRPASEEISEALKKKDRDKRDRMASRRRVRGGASGTVSAGQNDRDISSIQSQFDEFYGLLPPQQTVLVRGYSDDSDDRMLAEIQPRFIVIFEPNQDFIRRIEVYRSSNPGLGIRVYFMLYQTSCEEHKYLAGLRREKDAFERLIKERGTMLMPIIEDHRAGTEAGEAMIKTISTRVAGGRKEVSTEPSKVVVDMREFRSTLPSLLHASKLLVIPATLIVGDYILTPDICVERKSIPDLVSSFNSGRLYTQCELMSVHYKQPILLIEFEEYKSFSLEIIQDMKTYAKPTSKHPSKNKATGSEPSAPPSIQSKLVLLTLTFPRVRIIWSSSPYATADIFNDLKANLPEPDVRHAIGIGAERDTNEGAAGDGERDDAAAEELLRSLPGITDKNLAYVKRRVGSVRGLCDMTLEEVKQVLGDDPGKRCWEFLHWGERQG
ncbi:hypothetical protein HETIRDRAFT_127022 [Heterobasidion irregulare TC 32-1]|uniref:ERCC4 domain-containing protein n=1 Tax=Heterobasidion irregulare (strain TC 32-1) TaxID=747525 RepID=W4JNC0_HETIT|nr:uncharacterized protein HETIRDRAFT_127022 [Heterobasidion irregulare TC 32-1]ETW75057.1 hypothetical protein HETIRDRAFT_127022 [Heterobasidion irregulare TC 32-1]